jgi:hypothetical protein
MQTNQNAAVTGLRERDESLWAVQPRVVPLHGSTGASQIFDTRFAGASRGIVRGICAGLHAAWRWDLKSSLMV